MRRFHEGAVGCIVPGSSANLGPGFDALGLALSLHDELEVEVTTTGLDVEVRGPGEGEVPLDERHLVVRSMRAAFDALGGQPDGLRLRCRNAIPHARGLGSSSAAIVGGITLARKLTADAEIDDLGALRIATAIEGHPDNVAAALLGGLTIAWTGTKGADAARLDARGSVVALIPPTGVTTELARGLLPQSVPHSHAARNAGRSALLVAALTGRPDLLLEATEDLLHQSYRATAMPESYELLTTLRATGVPAIVSGAGPTVLAFVADELHATAALGHCPAGWSARELDIDPRGAR